MSKFDPEAFCKNIEKHQITFGLIVPPILVVLTRHPGLCQLLFVSFLATERLLAAEKYNLKSLRLLVSGAAPLGGPLVSAVQSRLRSFGNDTAIVQGFYFEFVNEVLFLLFLKAMDSRRLHQRLISYPSTTLKGK